MDRLAIRFAALILLVAMAFGLVSCKGMDAVFVDRMESNHELWTKEVHQWIKADPDLSQGGKLDLLLSWESWGRLIQAADEETE